MSRFCASPILAKQRAETLLAAKPVMPTGLAAIEQFKPGSVWMICGDIRNLVIPTNLVVALAQDLTVVCNLAMGTLGRWYRCRATLHTPRQPLRQRPTVYLPLRDATSPAQKRTGLVAKL
jgi:uncharacterized protein YdeI (YjbR/CyaY-like superfamily)